MIWLVMAVVVSGLLAWLVSWTAKRPRSLESGIDEFSQGLDALAPKRERGR